MNTRVGAETNSFYLSRVASDLLRRSACSPPRRTTFSAFDHTMTQYFFPLLAQGR
jgi:hypothetical protein